MIFYWQSWKVLSQYRFKWILTLNPTQVCLDLSRNYLESTSVMLSANTGWRYLNIIFGGHTSQHERAIGNYFLPNSWEEFSKDWANLGQLLVGIKSIFELELPEVKSVWGQIVHPGIVRCHQKLVLVHFGLYHMLLQVDPSATGTSSA